MSETVPWLLEYFIFTPISSIPFFLSVIEPETKAFCPNKILLKLSRLKYNIVNKNPFMLNVGVMNYSWLCIFSFSDYFTKFDEVPLI